MHHLIQTTAPGNKWERLTAAMEEPIEAKAENVATLPVQTAQKAARSAMAADIDEPVQAQAAE